MMGICAGGLVGGAATEVAAAALATAVLADVFELLLLPPHAASPKAAASTGAIISADRLIPSPRCN
jgi:hypothetical protein